MKCGHELSCACNNIYLVAQLHKFGVNRHGFWNDESGEWMDDGKLASHYNSGKANVMLESMKDRYRRLHIIRYQ